ncbi:MAG: O-antigen ligase family protein [Clostridiales bacterium]|nr:O-antigen ligase family protein [Clostridiales bacterium]
MIENSSILALIRRFAAWARAAASGGVTERAAMAIAGFFAGVWERSRVKSLVAGSFGMESAFRESAAGRGLHAVSGLFAASSAKLERLSSSSALLSLSRETDLALIGVYASVFFAAILPTKIMLAISALTVLAFAVQLMATGKARLAFRLQDLFALLFALIMIAGAALSYFPVDSAVTVSTYVLFILLYIAARHCLNTENRLRAVMSLVVAAGALVSLYGIYQKLTGSFAVNEAWLDEDMFGSANRVYSTLENPNVLGEFLIFSVTASFAGLYFFKRPLNKLLVVSALGLSAYCMALTQSRGAWLGLLAALALFALVYDRRLVWLAVPALLAAPFILPPDIIERFTSIGNMSDGSTSYRVNIWMASLTMIGVFWPIGIGMGTKTFIYVYGKYAYNAVNAPHSHNLFLQVIIDTGVWGLIALLAFLAVFFKDIFSRARVGGRDRAGAVLAAAAAGMFGFLVQGLTDNVWFNYRVVMFFWLMAAMSAGAPISGKEDTA